MIDDIFKLLGDQAAEILFEIITECVDDYLYIFDLQNDVLEISQSAVKRLNITSNIITNASNEIMKSVYEEDRKMLVKNLADICEGREKIHDLHYRWLDKEGLPVWINCRGIVIDDKQGNAEYLVGSMSRSDPPQAENPASRILFYMIREEMGYEQYYFDWYARCGEEYGRCCAGKKAGLSFCG